MNEVKLQTKLIKDLRKGGAYAKKWATQLSVGVPDIIAVVEGLTVFTECKFEKGWNKNTARTIKLSPKQMHELNALRDAGANVVVVVFAEIEGALYLAAFPSPRRSADGPGYEPFVVDRNTYLERARLWGKGEDMVGWLKENAI